MSSKNTIYLQLIIGTLFWGLNFHLAQISTSYLSPMGASAGRYFFAAIGILILFPFFGLKSVNKEMLRLSYKMAGKILLVGLSGVFLFNYFFFKGLVIADAINGALLIALNPVFTLIFSVFMLKVKVSKAQLIGVAVSLTGVLIVISQGDISVVLDLSFNMGDLFLLIASILFAFHNVLIHKYLPWINSVLLTLFTTCFGAVLFTLFSMNEWLNVPDGLLDNRFWISVAVMGFFGTTLSFMFWNKGVKQIGSGNTAIFLNLVPIYAATTGLFFDKIITFNQIIGGVFIGIGIHLAIKNSRKLKSIIKSSE